MTKVQIDSEYRMSDSMLIRMYDKFVEEEHEE